MLSKPPHASEYPDLVRPPFFSTVWRLWLDAVYRQFAAPFVWTAISTFQNNWADASGVHGGPVASYSIDPFGVVRMRGDLQRTGVPVAGEVMFTLPEGFRPVANMHFISMMNGPAVIRLTVQPGGSVIFQAAPAAAPTITLLSPIWFPTR